MGKLRKGKLQNTKLIKEQPYKQYQTIIRNETGTNENNNYKIL